MAGQIGGVRAVSHTGALYSTYLFQRGHHGDDLQRGGRHVPFRLGGFGTVLLHQFEVTATETALLYDPTVLGAPAAAPAGWPTWGTAQQGGLRNGEGLTSAAGISNESRLFSRD